jgi:hypothetical protein
VRDIREKADAQDGPAIRRHVSFFVAGTQQAAGGGGGEEDEIAAIRFHGVGED